MTTLAVTWNPNENFWSLHPTMLTVKSFKAFHDKDKTKGKAESSKIMWAIALLIDPNEQNTWRNVGITDKLNLIAEDHIGDKDFNWEHPEILELREEYENRCLTIAEKQLIRLEKKMTQREEFISKTPYSLDYYEENPKTGKVTTVKGTATQLDKMVIDSGKIYDQLEAIKDKIAKETNSGALRGGAEESASEKGEI